MVTNSFGSDTTDTLVLKYNIRPGFSNKLTISNNGNGITVPSGEITAGQGVPIQVIAVPSFGYHLSKWVGFLGTSHITDTLNDTTTVRLDSSNTTVIALFEKDTYTVTYKGNGNTGGTVPFPQTKTNGVPLTLAFNTGSLVKACHTFSGWNTTADEIGTSFPEGANYTVDTGITLYAKWTKNQYFIRYKGNGSDAGVVPDSSMYGCGSVQ